MEPEEKDHPLAKHHRELQDALESVDLTNPEALRTYLRLLNEQLGLLGAALLMHELAIGTADGKGQSANDRLDMLYTAAAAGEAKGDDA